MQLIRVQKTQTGPPPGTGQTVHSFHTVKSLICGRKTNKIHLTRSKFNDKLPVVKTMTVSVSGTILFSLNYSSIIKTN